MTVVQLEVIARTTPELIERIARVLRHRGATLEHLVLTTETAPVAAGGDRPPETDQREPGPRTRIELRARVNGDRDLLRRQLERLPDVHGVRELAGPTDLSGLTGLSEVAS